MKTFEELEKDIILERLSCHKGNRVRTAKDLAIGLRTLQRKLSLYKIQKPFISTEQLNADDNKKKDTKPMYNLQKTFRYPPDMINKLMKEAKREVENDVSHPYAQEKLNKALKYNAALDFFTEKQLKIFERGNNTIDILILGGIGFRYTTTHGRWHETGKGLWRGSQSLEQFYIKYVEPRIKETTIGMKPLSIDTEQTNNNEGNEVMLQYKQQESRRHRAMLAAVDDVKNTLIMHDIDFDPQPIDRVVLKGTYTGYILFPDKNVYKKPNDGTLYQLGRTEPFIETVLKTKLKPAFIAPAPAVKVVTPAPVVVPSVKELSPKTVTPESIASLVGDMINVAMETMMERLETALKKVASSTIITAQPVIKTEVNSHDSIYSSALKYKTRTEWQKGDSRAHYMAKKLGIYEDCVKHMPAYSVVKRHDKILKRKEERV